MIARPQLTGVAAAVDDRLAMRRRDADGHVLQRAAKAAHGVPLKMGKHQHGLVFAQPFAHVILHKVKAPFDRQGDLPVLVQDIAGRDVGKPVLADGLPVVLRVIAAPLIGGVAFDNGALQLFDQIGDQLGLQKVVPTRLAGGNFDGHPALERNAQRLIGAHQALCGNVTRKINLGFH